VTQTLRRSFPSPDHPPQSWIRIVWSGEVDAHSVQPLLETLRRACEREPLVLEVDLGGVTFLDCAGLRPLEEAHERLLDRMRLFDPSPAVTRLLGVLGLMDMFIIVGPVHTTSPPEQLSSQSGPDARGQRTGAPLAAESGLRVSPDERATIEQAKGLLMAVNGCDAPSAWEILRGQAKTHDVGIRVMARMLVDHAPSGLNPASDTVAEDVLAELARSGPPAG